MNAEVTRESLPNILLVDDDEVLRERLATAIRSRGYEVRTAGSSDEALREVAKDSPEMAVLDLRMPGGSGIDLMRELKRQDPATRVLMLTGYGSIATAVEAVREATGGFGADVCIEAVGHPAVLEQAFYARDLAGTVVQVGVPTPDMRFPDIPMLEFFGRGGALKPSWYGDCLPTRDFPLLVDLHLQGRLPLDAFVSETIDPTGIEDAFHKMERGEVLRSVVLMDDAAAAAADAAAVEAVTPGEPGAP